MIDVHEHLLCTTWSSLFRCPICLLRLVPLPHIISTVACVLKLPLWACHLLAITGTSAPLLHHAVYEESSTTRHFTCLQKYAPQPHFFSAPCTTQSSSLGVSSACHTWHYCCNFSALGAHLQAASWGITLACCDCHQHLIHSALWATSPNLDFKIQ